MVLEAERWLELRRFRALLESGASFSEIARETGLNWRTVKKYLETGGRVAPPRAATRPGRQQSQVIREFAPVIDAWLRAELLIKGTVVHERLVEQYAFAGNYQRVKLYLQEARPRIAEELGITPSELARLHRRFEVIPGAQGQVDWGDEGKVLAHMGIPKVYSFHMVLSYSRDPFCCFTTSQDIGAFFECHRRAFAHFGGVPGVLVYDRTKTVVRRHVAPGKAVPLHPEAVAFAGHYNFDIDVLAAYRPTGKGRVERQVLIVRDHVLAGRAFSSLEEMDAAFAAWVPMRRRVTHRTHGEVIGVRAARDHAALRPEPATPYLVLKRHLRPVGKDCLIAFDANLYSVPARKVRHRQLVEVRASASTVTLHSATPDAGGSTLLASHPRAVGRGERVVDEAHWDGLPDGHTRAVTWSDSEEGGEVIALHSRRRLPATPATGPLQALLKRTAAANIEVGRRPLSVYDQLAGFQSSTPTRPTVVKDARLNELVSTRIRATADKLGLPHLIEQLDGLARRADEAKLGYLDFLDLVLQEELAVRDERRFKHALRISKMPHHKTLDEFNFSFQPELDPRKIKDLATLSFVAAKANAALLGPPGVGKTHLAVALAVAACRAGFTVYFTTLDDMVRHLKAADAIGRLTSKLHTYLRPNVLVIDEVGYQPLDPAAANLVFQVISKRYERGSIILTSNKGFGEWGQVFGDDVLATAILDRLLHHCEIIPINGSSYRMQNQLQALKASTTGAA